MAILTDADFDVNHIDFVSMFIGNCERSQTRWFRNQSHQCKQKRVYQVSIHPDETAVVFTRTLSTCPCVVQVFFKGGINLICEKVRQCIMQRTRLFLDLGILTIVQLA